MNPEQILLVIISLSPLIFVKIFLLILLLFYILFAAIILRQVTLMNRVVEAQISPFMQTIAVLHLAAAIFTFLFALIVL
ncbi:hypothetical protein HZB97_03210 [Candidatus Gottesmanbacteria bacterium]|nr:hypothetical protein [Candidatus Gottesmanbacteria bacterium]